jgi:hypothetical protein
MTRAGGGRLHFAHVQAKIRTAEFFREHSLASFAECVSWAPGIERSINEMIRAGLDDPEVTDFLSWDADVILRPKDVAVMLACPYDVVGAPYSLGAIEWHQVAQYARAGVLPEMLPWLASAMACHFTPEQMERPVRSPFGTFLEVDGMGLGSLLFRRHVFERFIAEGHATPYSRTLPDGSRQREHMLFAHGRDPDNDTPEGGYKGEDYRFCAQWRTMGGKIYAYATAQTQHVKSHVFNACLEAHLNLIAKARVLGARVELRDQSLSPLTPGAPMPRPGAAPPPRPPPTATPEELAPAASAPPQAGPL